MPADDYIILGNIKVVLYQYIFFDWESTMHPKKKRFSINLGCLKWARNFYRPAPNLGLLLAPELSLQEVSYCNPNGFRPIWIQLAIYKLLETLNVLLRDV